MSLQLINRNTDLRQLRDAGFNIQIHEGYLFILRVPYVNARKEVNFGVLISPLQLAGDKTVGPSSHVVQFQGEQPCDQNGNVITGIVHSNINKSFTNGVTANLSFSNKPTNGYKDYFEKMTTYARIISAPAKFIAPSLSEASLHAIIDESDDSIFKYVDTNSSRAEINEVNQLLANHKIAIIGLGGTGSYILDHVAKSWVREINLFDGDKFYNHNAFRSPGAASIDELNLGKMKVDYFAEKYAPMREGLHAHAVYITEDNLNLLRSMNFVFIAIDDNHARGIIIRYLTENNISFIDVGMGVHMIDNKLIGILRTTLGYPGHYDHIGKRVPIEDIGINEYDTNIQTSELNALNALFAVIKWKKHVGCIQDLEKECHSTYSINVADLLNEEHAA